MAETLPEPAKLREGESKEESMLSEFQEELVHMAAILCGDHRDKSIPHKLVENMNVSDGADYVKNAFKRFLDECEKARRNNVDESTICIPPSNDDDSVNGPAVKSRSFASKLCSCIVCANPWFYLSFIFFSFLCSSFCEKKKKKGASTVAGLIRLMFFYFSSNEFIVYS